MRVAHPVVLNSELRKALDDESSQYIETIPRRGYRFVAERPRRRGQHR